MTLLIKKINKKRYSSISFQVSSVILLIDDFFSRFNFNLFAFINEQDRLKSNCGKMLKAQTTNINKLMIKNILKIDAENIWSPTWARLVEDAQVSLIYFFPISIYKLSERNQRETLRNQQQNVKICSWKFIRFALFVTVVFLRKRLYWNLRNLWNFWCRFVNYTIRCLVSLPFKMISRFVPTFEKDFPHFLPESYYGSSAANARRKKNFNRFSSIVNSDATTEIMVIGKPGNPRFGRWSNISVNACSLNPLNVNLLRDIGRLKNVCYECFDWRSH